MAFVSIPEFRQSIQDVCSISQIVMHVQVISETKRQVRLRIFLVRRTFVDIYYSAKTGKTAFAQIKDNIRIFGADNMHNWHWHPYEDPQSHNFTNGEITFNDFLKRVEENTNK